ncbi:hypothetical protein VNO77_16159 [Canavalia gladiata]|uniref:Uncharacterized protein n=1 Tax=Canavalia gladiata TaxID=3824 RepID=A0AAN9M0N5_CANGL
MLPLNRTPVIIFPPTPFPICSLCIVTTLYAHLPNTNAPDLKRPQLSPLYNSPFSLPFPQEILYSLPKIS